jgi:hypothetical protein
VLLLVAHVVLTSPCRADLTVILSETLIRLNVSPASAPTPALRYQLLPELSEMSPGNPIHGYYKCCMEAQAFSYDKEALDRFDDWLAMPLTERPAPPMQDISRSALAQMDAAARLDTPDWQILKKLKTDGFSLLLPDVQGMRTLARALQARFRSEVALGRIDDALRSAKTMLAMSRHLGQHPTAIGCLVGIAIANVGIQPLEELLEQPGCPNLYWALTNLPSPLLTVEQGVAGERLTSRAEFRDLDDGAPMSQERLTRFIAHLEQMLSEPGKSLGLRKWLDATTKDDWAVRAARLRLIEFGLPEDRTLRFPAEQVLLLDEKREFEVRSDDIMKLMTLPVWQFEMMSARNKPARTPALLADALAPSLGAFRRALGRLEQRIALLRHVEALRMYAAEHQGRFPEKLTDLAVPLPDDPFTGKPFRYETKGKTAHLRGTPPSGQEKNFGFNLHYEITLRD